MTALPPNAQRQLMRMRSLDPPIDLVDSIMAEVEATPQVRAWPDTQTIASFTLAAAAALLAIVVLLRFGIQNVGPAPTSVPLDELPSAGRLEARISVDVNDVPAAFGHGFLWLTSAATGELVRMDPANGSIASPVQVTEAGSAVPIAVTDTSVWVADSRDGTLVELDPASLEERRRIPVTATVSAMAAEGSDLWLLDANAGQLGRIDTVVGRIVFTVPIDAPSALLVHGGAIWVGDERGGLTRIVPVSGVAAGRVEVGVAAAKLVPDVDSIVIVGRASDPLVRVDIGSMQVAQRGIPAMAVAAEGGRIWAVLGSNHLVRLDAGTLQPVAASGLELDASGTMAIGSSSLWITGVDSAGDAYLLEVAPAP